MSSDLIYRIRTCAAAIAAGEDLPLLYRDAADLLLEASNEIVNDDFLEPMEIIPPQLYPSQEPTVGPTWTTGAMELPTRMDLGPHQPKPCPNCHILAPHTVHRAKHHLVLKCQACGHKWDWKP